MNKANMVNTAQPFSQGWVNGCATVIQDNLEVCQWLVPTVSSLHNTLKVYVDAESNAQGGAITFESESWGDSQVVNVGNGRSVQTLDLEVETGTEYELVKMTVNAVGFVKLYSVDASYGQAQNLPAGEALQIDADENLLPIHPIGDQAIAEQAPLSAFIAHVLSQNILNLRQRRRGFGGWSSWNTGQQNIPGASATQRPRLVMIPPGSMAGGVNVRVALRVVNSTNEEHGVNVTLTDPGGGFVTTVGFKIAPGTPDSWVVKDLDPVESGRIPSSRHPLTSEPFAWMRFDQGDSPAGTVLGWCAWGE